MIRAKHRYAFRLTDRGEEMFQALRENYRYMSDTEIIHLALGNLYAPIKQARERAAQAAPIASGAAPMTPLVEHHRKQKGGKACKAK